MLSECQHLTKGELTLCTPAKRHNILLVVKASFLSMDKLRKWLLGNLMNACFRLLDSLLALLTLVLERIHSISISQVGSLLL